MFSRRRLGNFGLALVAIALSTAPVQVIANPEAATSRTPSESLNISPDKEKTGVTDKEILIGSCLPLSGALQERGHQVTQGANAYLSYINNQGGVNGRHIKLVTYDDMYEGSKAVEVFDAGLKGQAFAGCFFVGSVAIGKYVQLGEANKMPLLGFCTGNPVAYHFHPTEFTFRPSFIDEVSKQVDELWSHGAKRIAVIYQLDSYGLAIRDGASKSLQKHGGTLVAEGSYHRQTSEIEVAFAEVKAAHPDAVILAATAGALKAAIQKRHDDKWPVIFSTFSGPSDYLRETGKIGNGVITSEVVPNLEDHQPAISSYINLTHKYTPKSHPTLGGFESFLNAMLLVEGLKRAGKDLTRTKFVRAMESIHNYDLGLPPAYRVNYSETNHNGLSADCIYFNIVKDGKLVPIKDSDWKMAATQE